MRAGPFDLAAAAAVAVLIPYAALDPRGALISLVVVLVILYLISTRLSWQVRFGAFIFGWGFQLGHNLERTKQKEFSIRVCR